jgi:hypothetical protein
LLSDQVTQPPRGAPTRAASVIRLGKGLATYRAAKASFQDDQVHLVSSQTHAAFGSLATIMQLMTVMATARTDGTLLFRDHFDVPFCPLFS